MSLETFGTRDLLTLRFALILEDLRVCFLTFLPVDDSTHQPFAQGIA